MPPLKQYPNQSVCNDVECVCELKNKLEELTIRHMLKKTI